MLHRVLFPYKVNENLSIIRSIIKFFDWVDWVPAEWRFRVRSYCVREPRQVTLRFQSGSDREPPQILSFLQNLGIPVLPSTSHLPYAPSVSSLNLHEKRPALTEMLKRALKNCWTSVLAIYNSLKDWYLMINVELKPVHVGQEIAKRLDELNMTKTEFGRLIGV